MSVPILELGEVSTIQIGPFGSLLHKADYVEDGVPVINPMHIAPHGIEADYSYSVRTSKADQLTRYFLHAGEVIMGRRGEMGRCAVVQPEQAGMICGTGSMKIIPETKTLNAEYLVHMIRTPKARAELENAASGVTMLNLNAKSLAKLKIPLPPLDEQKRIAGILDQADALRRLRTRALDKLNTLGQAIFHEMFGETAAHGKNWPKHVLADLIVDDDRINYGVVQPGDHEPGGVPIIRVADLAAPVIDFAAVKRISKEIDSNYERSRLKGGEILIGCVGSIGTAIIAPPEFKGANIARAVARVAVDPKKCDPEFVAEYMRSDVVQRYFQKEVRLVAQPTLNIKQIRETEIVVPPADLQAKFLERLNVIKECTKRASKGFLEQQSLFSSLQHRAFRGEL